MGSENIEGIAGDKLLAHITTAPDGRVVTQTLKSHSYATSEYAAISLASVGLGNVGRLAGLLHDMGKATRDFNDYLAKAFNGDESARRGSVNHTFAGVVYVLEEFSDNTSPMAKLTKEIIAFAIGSHHGLFDAMDKEGNSGFQHRIADKGNIHYEEAVSNFLREVASEGLISELFSKSVGEIDALVTKIKGIVVGETQAIKSVTCGNYLAFACRLVLSAVIYGDRRDTSEFMSQQLDSISSVDWGEVRECFDAKYGLLKPHSEIDRLRSSFEARCREGGGHLPCGTYLLNIPTGGGKTLSSLSFAIEHAKKLGKKRIIFVIPLLSILEQNAAVIKEYVGSSAQVLEHHSDALNQIASNGNSGDEDQEVKEYELLSDRWDSPIIVTTMVRILEIIFGHKSSDISRFRALADSVLVFDEIQYLPRKGIYLYTLALNFLNRVCGSTLVLSSATQPSFDKLDYPILLGHDGNPLEKDIMTVFSEERAVFKRAEIEPCLNAKTDEEFFDFCKCKIEEFGSALVVCNTKREAQSLFYNLKEQLNPDEYDVCHLSTYMCKAHRSDVLSRLNERLDARLQGKCDKKQICVSTQLIEAGVDISFECVIRVLAGIESIMQAAGRCNRNNEYGKGKTYVVELKSEANMAKGLREIVDSKNAAKTVLKTTKVLASIDDERIIESYYTNLFSIEKNNIRLKYDVDKGKYSLLEKMAKLYVKGQILGQPFAEIADWYRVFDEESSTVVVPYGKDAEELIGSIKSRHGKFNAFPITKGELRALNQYSIGVFDSQLKRLKANGMIDECIDGQLLVLDSKAYDIECGLVPDKEKTTDDFIC